jgi:transposase
MRANHLSQGKKSKKGAARGDSIFRVEMRRAEVAKLYAQKVPEAAIAQRTGVSIGTISNDLRILREEYVARARQATDQAIAEELIQIDYLWREANEAWEKSKTNITFNKNIVERALRKKQRDIRRDKASLFNVPEEEPDEFVPVRFIEENGKKYSNGDPRFLAIMQWCVEVKLKLCGKMATEINVTNNNIVFNWDEFIAGAPVVESEQKIIEIQGDSTPQLPQPQPLINGAH